MNVQVREHAEDGGDLLAVDERLGLHGTIAPVAMQRRKTRFATRLS